MFIAEFKPYIVEIYDVKYRKIGQINTDYFPELTTDREGNLYAGYAYKPLVQIFAPPYDGKPIDIEIPPIDGNSQQVNGVAVDEKTGLIAVASEISGHFGGPGGVTFFRRGETTPCSVVSGDTGSAAFSSDGTLYYTDMTRSPYVGMIRGGCDAKTRQPLEMQKPLFYPYGLQITSKDDVVLVEPSDNNSETIHTYALPVHGKYGKPLAQLHVAPGCAFRTLSSDGAHAWLTCGPVEEIPYPGGGPPTITIKDQRHAGPMAVLPPVNF